MNARPVNAPRCLPVQSPPHVKQRRSIHANCACILTGSWTKTKTRIQHWRIHLRRFLVHKVKGQTQTAKEAGEGIRSDAAAASSSSSLPALNTLSLPCSFLVGCGVQWAPFPQFIRANVMSEDQSPPPSPHLHPHLPTHRHSPLPTPVHPAISVFIFSLPPRQRVIVLSDVTLASQGESVLRQGLGDLGDLTSSTHTVWGAALHLSQQDWLQGSWGKVGVCTTKIRSLCQIRRSCASPPSSSFFLL